MSGLFQTVSSDGGIYFLLLFYFFLIAFLEAVNAIDGYRIQFTALSAVILVIFLGFRWETGTDWDSYKELFDSLELDWSFLLAVYSFDPGYVFFNALVRLFTDQYTIFLVSDAVVGLYLVYYFIVRSSPFPNISIYIFYTSYFVAHFMGSNRRLIAIAALLVAIYYLFESRVKRHWAMYGTAFLFHRSSGIGAVIWLIPKKIFTPKTVFIVLGICLMLGLSQAPFKAIETLGTLLYSVIDNPIFEKMVFYSETSSEHVSENVDIVTQTILAVAKRAIFIFYYWYVTRGKSVDKFTGYLYNIYIVGFAGYLLMVGSPIFQVVTTYFAIVEISLTARMFAYSPQNSRLPFMFAIFAYGVLQLVSALNPYRELYMPYLSIFSGSSR